MRLWSNKWAIESIATWLKSGATPPDSWLNTAKMIAFMDNISPDPLLSYADMTQPTFTGYTAGVDVTAVSDPILFPPSRFFMTATPMMNALCAATPAEAETITGFLIYSTIGGDKSACFMLLDTPITIAEEGQGWSVEPQLLIDWASADFAIG